MRFEWRCGILAARAGFARNPGESGLGKWARRFYETVDLPSSFRADSLRESKLCDGVARFCWLRAIHTCRAAGGTRVAAAKRFLAEFASGIEDGGTEKNGTIHAFA